MNAVPLFVRSGQQNRVNSDPTVFVSTNVATTLESNPSAIAVLSKHHIFKSFLKEFEYTITRIILERDLLDEKKLDAIALEQETLRMAESLIRQIAPDASQLENISEDDLHSMIDHIKTLLYGYMHATQHPEDLFHTISITLNSIIEQGHAGNMTKLVSFKEKLHIIMQGHWGFLKLYHMLLSPQQKKIPSDDDLKQLQQQYFAMYQVINTNFDPQDKYSMSQKFLILKNPCFQALVEYTLSYKQEGLIVGTDCNFDTVLKLFERGSDTLAAKTLVAMFESISKAAGFSNRDLSLFLSFKNECEGFPRLYNELHNQLHTNQTRNNTFNPQLYQERLIKAYHTRYQEKGFDFMNTYFNQRIDGATSKYFN